MQMKEQEEQSLQIPVLLRNKIDNLEQQLREVPEKIASLINQRSAPHIVDTAVPQGIPSRGETLLSNPRHKSRDSPPHMRNSVKPDIPIPVKEELPLSAEPEESSPPVERLPMGRGSINYPKTNEYPTFEGKPDEDWVNFIEIIDTLQIHMICLMLRLPLGYLLSLQE